MNKIPINWTEPQETPITIHHAWSSEQSRIRAYEIQECAFALDCLAMALERPMRRQEVAATRADLSALRARISERIEP